MPILPPLTQSVIVMNMNHIGLGIIRNFKDTDFHIMGIAKKKNFVCSSKYLRAVIEINIENEPDRLLEKLLEIGQDLSGKGFIVPTSEVELMFLISHAGMLSEYYHLSIPETEKFIKVTDKYLFYTELRKHSFHTPETFLLESKESMDGVAGRICFPCILKPVFSGDWKTGRAYSVVGAQKAMVIHSRAELEKYYDLVSHLRSKVLLQQIVRSEDGETYSFCCYADSSGKVLWGCVTQKLLQYPENFGTALMCQTVREPEIYQLGLQLVEKLGIDGICEVEIMREQGSGELYIIEVNTRHWQQHILSSSQGINISMLDYYCRTGQSQMAHAVLSAVQAHPEPALWLDDRGYILYSLKHYLHPGMCKFSYLKRKKICFSTYRRDDFRPYINILKERVLV